MGKRRPGVKATPWPKRGPTSGHPLLSGVCSANFRELYMHTYMLLLVPLENASCLALSSSQRSIDLARHCVQDGVSSCVPCVWSSWHNMTRPSSKDLKGKIEVKDAIKYSTSHSNRQGLCPWLFQPDLRDTSNFWWPLVKPCFPMNLAMNQGIDSIPSTIVSRPSRFLSILMLVRCACLCVSPPNGWRS